MIITLCIRGFNIYFEWINTVVVCVEFYKRNGFHLNTYPYTQPPLSKGQSPVPLLVMTYGKAVTNSGFEAIKDELYSEVYNNIDL